MLKLLKQDLILPDGVNVSTLVEFQVILVTGFCYCVIPPIN